MSSYELLKKSEFRYRKHLECILRELKFKTDDFSPEGEIAFKKGYGKDADILVKIDDEGMLKVIVPEYTLNDGTLILNYFTQRQDFEALKPGKGNPDNNQRIFKRCGFPENTYNISREIEYSVEAIALADAAVRQAVLLKEKTGPETKMTEEDVLPLYENMKKQFEFFMSEQH